MIAEFSIIPVGVGESLSKYVSKIVEVVVNSGLEYRLTPMSTIVEGDTDQVFELIKKCHKQMLEYSNRVITVVNIDDRKGFTNRIKGKIESIKSKLNKDIKTIEL